jgi:hypothetical protein
MRLICRICFLLTISLALGSRGSAQEACTFSIGGDWQSTVPGDSSPNLYRFAPDGTVTVFSQPAAGRGSTEIAKAAYGLDNPRSPKTVEFKPLPGARAFPWGLGRMEIVDVSDNSFTILKPGVAPATWVRNDPEKYFVVLAAHRGTPPHFGGPAFVMLIKKPAGGETQFETFGLYYRDQKRINGRVPTELIHQFIKDSGSEQDSVLRLEVTAQQFSRAMKIVHSWQKRATDGALLFPPYSYLNVVVPLKEVADSLNACGETIKLHQLTWMVDDEIGANFAEWELSYRYVKRLRDLNERVNVSEARLQQTIGDTR